MKLGLSLGYSGPQLQVPLEKVKLAERLGFDSGTMMDNLIYTGVPDDEVRPTFETWSVLPALAEATSKIRIVPQVTPCLRRAPASWYWFLPYAAAKRIPCVRGGRPARQ